MNYDQTDLDGSRDVEMIWTLFQGKEEEDVPKKNKEGVTVKILKFLFGSGGGFPEEPQPVEYSEKRRFHRHVYHPSPRHADHPIPGDLNGSNENQNWTKKRLQPSPDLSPPGPSPPGHLYQTLCRLIVAVTLASILVMLSSASTCLQALKALLIKGEDIDETVD